MSKPVITALGVVLIAGVLSGCTSSNNSSVSLPTSPTTTTTGTTTTQTFTGNLNQNGAATMAFTSQAGSVTATLTSLGDPSATVGLALGGWSGTACTVAVANDAATVGAVITGTASATANLCVRIYDVGLVTATIPFTVTITHP